MTELRSHPSVAATSAPREPAVAARSRAVATSRAPAPPRDRRAVHRSLVVLWLADAVALAAVAVLVGSPTAAVAGYALAVLLLVRHRRVPISLRLSTQFTRLAVAAALPAFALLPWLGGTQAWRLGLAAFGALVVARGIAYMVLLAERRRGRLCEAAVIVGAGRTGRLVARILMEHPELGIAPIGFVDGSPHLEATPLPMLCTVAGLTSTVERLSATRVLVCFPVEPDRDLLATLRELQSWRIDVCIVPRFQELATRIPAASLDEVWGVPLLPMRWNSPSALGRVGKRLFDVVVASVLLCLLAPFFAVAALLIRLRLGRPVIFRQQRVIADGRTSTIYKLRTLPVHDQPDTTWEVPMEGVSKLGRWLRASHVDELPQLVNVIRGEMSLVGPRPERPYFVEQFRKEIPDYDVRLRTPAGLTGWSQVHGLHGDTSIRERVRFDNQYIETRSPWLDVVILMRTVTAAVRSARRSRP